MGWGGLGFFVLLLLTLCATAVIGLLFWVISWAYRGREGGQDAITASRWTFRVAVLLSVIGGLMIYMLDSPLNLDLPPVLLLICWILLIATLIFGRQKTGAEIFMIKLGSFVLLGIGCLGLISLTAQ